MKCFIKVLCCLLMVVLVGSESHAEWKAKHKQCAKVVCPPEKSEIDACKKDQSKALIRKNDTELCCTYCVKVLKKGEHCVPVKKNSVAQDTVCIVPPGYNDFVGNEVKDSSSGQMKAALFQRSLLVFDLFLSLAGIFYISG